MYFAAYSGVCRIYWQRRLSPAAEFSEVGAGQVAGVQPPGLPDRYADQLCRRGQAVPGVWGCQIVRNCAAAVMQENFIDAGLIY